jgi:uncharacterized protein (TIGR01370 family)
MNLKMHMLKVKVKKKKESDLLQPENGKCSRRRAVKIRRHYLRLFFLSFLLLSFFLIGIQKETTVDHTTAESSPLPLSSVRYWAYQLQDLDTSGAIDKIVNSQYDMVVIEPTVTYDPDFDARDMVNRIKASKASDGIHRKLVFAYIDIGEAEEWRWYWGNHKTYEAYGECKNAYINQIQQWAPWVVACDPDGWAGNYPVAFWDDDWKDIVIYGTTLGSNQGLYFNSMLDEVVQDGFDGVYLDWVEAWEMDEVQERAENEGKDPGQEMLNFIKEIRTYGKQYNEDFLVVQQNSSELINEVGANALKNAVDAIAQEGVWWDGVGGNDDWYDPEGYDYPSCCTSYYLSRLRKYKNAGFPVFVCDYAVQKADEVYQKAAAEGFIAYATRRSLSKLTTTPPTFEEPNPPVIAVDRTQLHFGAVMSGSSTGAQDIYISNTGEGTLNWTITDDAAWLSPTPSTGTGDASVTVSVDASGLSAGTYTGTMTISDPNASNSPQSVSVTLNVYSWGGDAAPFGSFETPINGSTVRSSVPVTGWVLDDVGIDSVKVYRQEGPGLVYIGDALLVEGARPDIEQAYPTYPMNDKAGWGYMLLTNFLPNNGNGTFNLVAKATDSSGHEVTLGTKTITCDNANAVKPFGAIDTPVPGSIASGSAYRNQGWVLTPMPNHIPTDGSTIDVYVDGVHLGHPVYNIYRSDIASLFPGYANSGGAHAYFDFDTTTYANGVHTIYWTASDNVGNTDGIGSRYFTIQNSHGAGRNAVSNVQRSRFNVNLKQIPVYQSQPVSIKKGYFPNTNPIEIYPDDKGFLTIEIKELQCIEVRLFPVGSSEETRLAPLLGCTGYQFVGHQLRPLPIGSTLDRKRGVFYWQPGPGFLGRYQLVFIKNKKIGEEKKKHIIINIVPFI